MHAAGLGLNKHFYLALLTSRLSCNLPVDLQENLEEVLVDFWCSGRTLNFSAL
jgi:hypothetical protein